MAKITNSGELEEWLKNRPRQDAVSIAARAALRVLPLLMSASQRDTREPSGALVLAAFHGVAAANLAGSSPTVDAELLAAVRRAAIHADEAVADYKEDGVTPVDEPAYAAVEAISLAAAAIAGVHVTQSGAIRVAQSGAVHVTQSERVTVIGAAVDATNAAARNAYAADVWSAVSSDATALERGTPHESLGASPIWRVTHEGISLTIEGATIAYTPKWAADAWSALKRHLLDADEGWEVWTDWYDAILEGRPLDPDLELKKALIPDQVWKQGPAVVNAEIARLIAQHYAPARPVKNDPVIRGTSGEPILDTAGNPILDTSRGIGTMAVGETFKVAPTTDAVGHAERQTRPLALADFRYDSEAHIMRMLPFPEDVPALDDAVLRRNLADRLSELRDACLDLEEDIRLDKRQVPGSLGRDLTRYAREAALGPEEARPGRLRWVGDALIRAQQDEDIGFGLGNYLRPRLDEIVASHLRLQARFHAGLLERMAPLADARLDATPEQAEAEVRDVLDKMQSEAWRDLPRIPDEFPEIIEQQLEQLRAMAATVDLKPEGEARDRLIRQMEEGHITLLATTAQCVLRVLQWAGENKAMVGASVLLTILMSLMALVKV